MPARRIYFWLVAVFAFALCGLPATRAAAQHNVAFVTVALDPETRKADDALAQYLQSKTALQFDPMPMDTRRRSGGSQAGSKAINLYVARLTRYVYIAAEMLGANVEILGTYNSRATAATTYRSGTLSSIIATTSVSRTRI